MGRIRRLGLGVGGGKQPHVWAWLGFLVYAGAVAGLAVWFTEELLQHKRRGVAEELGLDYDEWVNES
jgi:hypothetical protein